MGVRDESGRARSERTSVEFNTHRDVVDKFFLAVPRVPHNLLDFHSLAARDGVLGCEHDGAE